MAVVVKNESASPYVFDGSSGRRQIAPDAIEVISDSEWSTVITAKRGPGQLNAIWPNESTSNTEAQRFDYYQVGAEFEIRYIGIARQGTLTGEDKWTIKRLEHAEFAGVNNVTAIQILERVAWDDRASLPWV